MKSIHSDILLEADYRMGKWGLAHQLMQGGLVQPPGSRAEPYKPGFTLIHFGPDPCHLFEGGLSQGDDVSNVDLTGFCYEDNLWLGRWDLVNSQLTYTQKSRARVTIY